MAIITPQATYISDGTLTGKIDLNVIYRKTLKTILGNRIGLINATIENRDNMNGGTGIYYIAQKINTRNYTNGTQPNNLESTRVVQVLLDKRKEWADEKETFDLALLGAKLEDGNITVADSLVSAWIDAKAKSIEAYLFAKLVDLGVKTAISNGIVPLTLPATPTSDDYRQAIWKKIANILASKISTVTAEYWTLDPEDFYLWTSNSFKNEIILALSNLGSDKTTETLRDGKVELIGGIKVIDCPVLGGDYGVGIRTGFDQDENFDFSACDALLIHKEALAFPFNMVQSNTFILQGNGNVKDFSKFAVNGDGGKPLRPELVVGLKLTQASTTPSQFIVQKALLIQDFAGATPTSTELDKMVLYYNPYFKTGNVMVTWGTITSTSAIGTPVSPYTGDPITVTYVKAV